MYAGGSIEDYLVSRTDVPVRNPVVWLIRYADFSDPHTGPITADGSPAEGGTITHAYMVVDAFTGDWLYTTATE